jgi:acetylornithine/N-succinyldiaminopimelate aminotransferase
LFRQRLSELVGSCPIVREVRGQGVMIGVELSVDAAPGVKACMERRLLVNCTQGTVLRLLPALNIAEEQVQEGCDILIDVIKQLAGS